MGNSWDQRKNLHFFVVGEGLPCLELVSSRLSSLVLASAAISEDVPDGLRVIFKEKKLRKNRII
jgi:hypothetical protein